MRKLTVIGTFLFAERKRNFRKVRWGKILNNKKQNMIDILIPLSRSSNNHIELMYTLRAIEKFAIGYRNIYIIGEKPKFINYDIVKHYKFKNSDGIEYKQHNILAKTKFACQIPDLSDDFLFMNDDHFFCAETDVRDYPVYFGESFDKLKISDKNVYQETVKNTIRFFTNRYKDKIRGTDFFNFDVHTPIIYNKESFIRMAEMLKDMPKNGCCLKTMYCYLRGEKIEPIFINDLKVKSAKNREEFLESIKDRHVFSCGDSAWKTRFKVYMKELYSVKSKFEI